MSTATLGFQIDSSPAAAAAANLDELTASAGRTTAAVDKLETEAASLGASLGKTGRGAREAQAPVESLGRTLAQQDDHVRAFRMEVERMTAKFQPAAAATKAYEASVSEIERAHRLGIISAQQMQRALDAERMAYERLKTSASTAGAAMKAANSNTAKAGGVSPADAMLYRNLAFQANQIGQQGAVTGNYLQALTVQLPDIMASFGSLPMVLAGGVAAVAASILPIGDMFRSVFGVAKDEVKDLETLLSDQQKAVERIRDLWGEAADQRSRYGRVSTGSATFGLDASIADMTKRLISANKPSTFGPGEIASSVTGAIDKNMDLTGLSSREFRSTTLYKQLQIDFQELQKATLAGKPDILSLIDSLEQIGQSSSNAGIKQMARDAVEALQPFRDLAEALREAEREARRLFDDRGPNGMLLSRGATNAADMGNLALFESRNRIAADRDRQSFDAQIYAIGARSPQERAEAARRSEAAKYDMAETPEQRRTRIEQAGTLALVQAEKQLSDARRDRALNLDKMIEDQQSEIDLLGKTGGAAAALRKEYELTAQIRLDAARQGIEVDQKELDLIKQRAAELGKLVDLYNQQRFTTDFARQVSDARLSDQDRKIVTTLRSYGLPEDLNSANASMIAQQMQWQEAKDLAKSFGSTFSSALLSTSGDIGKSFAMALKAALEKETQKLWDKVFDGLSTIFADLLFGNQTTGSLNKSIGFTGANTTLGNLLGAGTGISAANQNVPAAMGSMPGGSIASYVAQAATQRGIDPNIALRVAQSEGGLNSWNLQSNFVKNGIREDSWGPYQLYMNGGLGNEFMRKTGLDPRLAQNGPAGVDFALDYAKQNGWGSWYGAGKAGIGNWEGIGTGTEAISKLGSAATTATKGLDTFGGGLGKLGSTLSSMQLSPMSGGAVGQYGGLWGAIGKLFGGISPTSPLWAPNTTFGQFIGAYADGTDSAPGGLAVVGERGPELVNLPEGARVFSNHKSMDMMRGGGREGGNARPILNVIVQGASGDDHIRELSRQGAQEALYQYDQNQTRGGFGQQQQNYAKRKG